MNTPASLAAALCLAVATSAITSALVAAYYQAAQGGGEVTIRGGNTKALTIVPAAPNAYAPVKWLDQKGCVMAMIVAHEQTTDRASTHNHFSIYTAGAPPADGSCAGRKGVVDIQFGTDDRLITVEDARLRIRKSARLELQSADGRYHEIAVGEDGNLSLQPAQPIAQK